MTEAAIAAPESAPATEPVPASVGQGEVTLDRLTDIFRKKLHPEQDRSADGKFKAKEPKDGEPAPAAAAAEQTKQTPESESATPEEAATDVGDIPLSEEAETEQPPAPVDAPSSWPAELRPAFAKLPPAEQKQLAEWQAKRDRDIDAMVNSAKEAKQKAETELEPERAKVRAQLTHLQAALQHYANPLIGEYRKAFPDLLENKITEVQLATDDAVRYDADGNDRWAAYQGYQARFDALQRSAQRVNEELQAHQKADYQKFRVAETAKYRDQHKLADDAAWATHNEELTKFGESFGFTPEELAYADARHMTVLRAAMDAGKGSQAEQAFVVSIAELGFKDGLKDKDGKPISMIDAARRYAKALAAKQKAEATPQPRPVPKVAMPGVATRQPDAKSQELAAANSQFAKTGKERDLVNVFKVALRSR